MTSGTERGQPSAFNADVSYTAQPGAPVRHDVLRVNHPLAVDGAQV